MTEYDYSPEAEARFWRKMDSVKQWCAKTGHYSLANPFEPRTPAASVAEFPDIPRARTMPPPGDVYGQQYAMPYAHVQVPQLLPQQHPQHKPRRTHSHHAKPRHNRSSSTSYASASTATLVSRPMPPPLPQNYPPMPPMIMPQPIRANTYPANAGYPQPMHSGGHPTQSMQWGRVSHVSYLLEQTNLYSYRPHQPLQASYHPRIQHLTLGDQNNRFLSACSLCFAVARDPDLKVQLTTVVLPSVIATTSAILAIALTGIDHIGKGEKAPKHGCPGFLTHSTRNVYPVLYQSVSILHRLPQKLTRFRGSRYILTVEPSI